MVTQVVDYFHLNNIYNKSEIVSNGTTLSDSIVSILVSLYILLRFFALSYTLLGNLLSRILDLTIMILLTIICKTLVDIFLFRDITDLLLFHISHPIPYELKVKYILEYLNNNLDNYVARFSNVNDKEYFVQELAQLIQNIDINDLKNLTKEDLKYYAHTLVYKATVSTLYKSRYIIIIVIVGILTHMLFDGL